MLHKRHIEFAGRKAILGGTAGACVAEHMRERGITSRMMKKGLEVLKEQKCDVACLNADPLKRKTAFKLHKNVGFKLMDRKISFEDIHGNISMTLEPCSFLSALKRFSIA